MGVWYFLPLWVGRVVLGSNCAFGTEKLIMADIVLVGRLRLCSSCNCALLYEYV